MVKKVKEKREYNAPSKDMRSTVWNSGSNEEIDKIHGLLNPFAESARGSKIPDNNSSRSIPMTLKWATEKDNDANGNFAISIAAPLQEMRLAHDSINPSTKVITWASWGAQSDWSTVSGDISSYRIVSWGVKIFSLAAPTKQQGFYRVITNTFPPGQATTLNPQSGLFERVEDYPVANANIHWVSKPIGEGYKEYVVPTSTQFGTDWESLIVYGSGGEPSVVNRVEVFVNIEAQPKVATIGGTLATPAAPHHPLRESAVDHARVRHEPKSTSTGSFFSYMKNLATEGLKAAGRMIAPYAFNTVNRLTTRYLGNRAPQLMLTN